MRAAGRTLQAVPARGHRSHEKGGAGRTEILNRLTAIAAQGLRSPPQSGWDAAFRGEEQALAGKRGDGPTGEPQFSSPHPSLRKHSAVRFLPRRRAGTFVRALFPAEKSTAAICPARRR